MKKGKALKILTILVLAILTVTFLIVPVNANIIFSDLSADHWCYNKIIDFENKNYVCGYEDGTFRPDRTITRAEYVKIVNNFFGYELEYDNETEFNDVSSGDWFAPYVNAAVERGYITGYEDGSFKPYDPIRRQEATVILARILKIDKEKYPTNHPDGLAQYTDSDEVQDWAKVAIHSYSVYNFINGYEDGSLRILENITRAETVELLHILEQKVIINKNKGGGHTKITRVSQPVIAAYEQINNQKKVVEGWVNNETKIKNGTLVKITCATSDAEIYYSINDEEEKLYTGEFYLPDGKYEIKARAERILLADSTTAIKSVEIDTAEPVASGIMFEDGVQIFVTDNDKFNVGITNISGLSEETLEYAWFTNVNGDYVRETKWIYVENGSKIAYPENPGVYYLGVKGTDKAENMMGQSSPFGNIDDKIYEELEDGTESGDISGDKPTDDPFVIVTEKENSGDKPTEDVPSGDKPIEDIPSGDKPSGDTPIEVVIKATITTNHIYNDDETRKVVECNKDKVPGEIYIATQKEEPNYNISGDLTLTVSRKNSENIINIYYERILVNITFDGNTATSGDMSGDIIPAGNTEKLSENKFEKPGYDFAGWSGDNGKTYPDSGDFTAAPTETEVKLYATWVAREDTSYKVEHYKQNLDGTYPEEATETENKTGTTDTLTNASAKNYAGFTAQSFEQANIKGDGTTVVKIYYVRNSYKLTVEYVREKDEKEMAGKVSGDYLYEESYRIVSPEIAGYEADIKVVSGDMPAEDKLVTVTYVANTNTSYKVEHYKQNLDGTYPEEATETENKTGTTDTLTNASAKDYAGFTAQSFEQANIKGDGTTVVKIYYSRNKYTVTWQDEDGTVLETDPNVLYGATPSYDGETPSKASDAQYSYEFAGWTPRVTAVSGNATYTATYTKTAIISKYSLKYYANNGTSENYESSESPYESGATVTVLTIEETGLIYEGYVFVGWKDDNENNYSPRDLLTITEDVNLYAQWKSDEVVYDTGLLNWNNLVKKWSDVRPQLRGTETRNSKGQITAYIYPDGGSFNAESNGGITKIYRINDDGSETLVFDYNNGIQINLTYSDIESNYYRFETSKSTSEFYVVLGEWSSYGLMNLSSTMLLFESYDLQVMSTDNNNLNLSGDTDTIVEKETSSGDESEKK